MAFRMISNPLYRERDELNQRLMDAAFDEDESYTLLDHLELLSSKIQVIEDGENPTENDWPERLISKLESIR